MPGQRIHITVDLEDLIRTEIEIRDREAVPLYGATDEGQYLEQLGYVKALRWVLQQAHAELDE